MNFISTTWNFLKPHLLPVIGFIIITIIAFHPMIFEGKVLDQHDVKQYAGGVKQIRDYEDKTGNQALWNYSMFCGIPILAPQFQGDFLDDIQNILSIGLHGTPKIFWLACLSFYVMLLTFKVKPWIAFLGAVFFSFNGFNVISIIAGHNTKILSVAYVPMVIAGLKIAFDGKRLLGAGLLGLALALEIRANHPQITYYLFIIILVYGLYELIKVIGENRFPSFVNTSLILIAVAIIAVGANFGKLWTTYEYSNYSTRGKAVLKEVADNNSGLDKEYTFRYSNSIFEPLVMFYPNIMGGPSQQSLDRDSEVGKALKNAGYSGNRLIQQLKAIPTYWGKQPLTAPFYVGSSVLLLFIIGIMYADRLTRKWLLSIIILGVVLSWGKNFSAVNDLIFEYVPGYNKFRSVTFTMIIPIFSIVTLSAIGLDRLIKDDNKNRIKKNILISLGIAIGFSLLLFVIGNFLKFQGVIDQQINADWFIEALRSERRSLYNQDLVRVIIFSVLSGTLLWFWMKDKIKPTLLILGLILVGFADIFGLTSRYLKDDLFVDKRKVRQVVATEADKYILKKSKPGERVLNLINPFNEANTSYFHESIGGYHGAKMRRYQDLISGKISPEMSTAIQRLQKNQRNFKDLNTLNMLNTRYLKAGNKRNAVIENPDALGAAWTVNRVIQAESPDEVFKKIDAIDVAEEALINQNDFDIETKYDGSGNIELIKKTPNLLTYEANIADGKTLAVFSEVYYPEGWIAEIDGEEVPVYRVNYLLRAIEVPDGIHTIKFRFEPKSYTTGNVITIIFNVILILFFIGVIGRELRPYFRQT